MSDLEYLKKYYDGNIEDAIKKYESGVPVQYIVGNVDFYGLNFIVNSNVLIPRFETEELVAKTVDYINRYFYNSVDIVDLGCGSGCISVTLSKLLGVSVDAVDVSSDALEVAKKNAVLNNVSVNFYLGDMLKPLNKKYDVIISNPPYIAYDEDIMDVVRNNEPSIALYASNNGLYFYEEILRNASNYLKDRSMICFEIGYLQGESVRDIALRYFPNSRVVVSRDLSDRDRFVFIFNGLE
ncbi:MAG: peptide chain release factor N(5)-glutamine methyltransferase [Bacilli bacterium]|nr:peptide chain release factor N(5)-glutamine methyltransferase [Bacilli bacterium]